MAAVEAGADALGFVFEKSSKRFVGELWPELCRQIPPFIYRVGVFGPPPDVVPDGLHAVQALWEGARVIPKNVDLICTVRAIDAASLPIVQDVTDFRALLLDAFDPEAYGGTGKTVDAEFAEKLVSSSPLPVILAGGLTPDNVADSVRKIRPFAVDVSSGVEVRPGVKSEELIWKFVKNAQKAFEA